MKYLFILLLAFSCAQEEKSKPTQTVGKQSCQLVEDRKQSQREIEWACPIGGETCRMIQYPKTTHILCANFKQTLDYGYEL